MRYLTSISLALVVLMALACTATPATPAGPMYSEEEAIAVLKEHLQTKVIPGFTPGQPIMPGTVIVVPRQLFGQSTPCLSAIEDKATNPVTWSAKYDNEGHRWDVRADSFIDKLLVGTPNPSAAGAWAESLFVGTPQPQLVPRESVPRAYSWSVYERTKSIVATGDDPLNRMC
jgi:hypothetical protein